MQFPLDPANASYHFKKFVYNFDHPNIVSECGTVDVYDNLVIAHFPRKINGSTTSYLIEKNSVSTVEVSVGHKLIFAYDWLPIYSYTDVLKCQDMLARLYAEYLQLSNKQPVPSHPLLSRIYDTQHTFKQTHEYLLDCKESYQHTVINLNLWPKSINPLNTTYSDPHVQIIIDNFLLFDSKREFLGLPSETISFLFGSLGPHAIAGV